MASRELEGLDQDLIDVILKRSEITELASKHQVSEATAQHWLRQFKRKHTPLGVFGNPWTYVFLLVYYLFLNLVPWGLVYYMPFYVNLVEIVGGVVPSVHGLPDEVRFGGLAYSKAQLTFIHTSGLLFCVFCIARANRTIWKRRPETWRFCGGFFGASFLSFISLWVLWIWPGTFNHSPEDAYHSNEWEMTAMYVAWWSIIAAGLSFASVFVRELYARAAGRDSLM